MVIKFRICHFLLILLPINLYAASWWDSEDYYHGYEQVNTKELLAPAQAGTVLFIDTREPEEFAEGHIPGAINIPLRDSTTINVEDFQDYTHVVPYCLKDFRGFEVARRLLEQGLNNVTMMNPPGLRGWQSFDLPMVSESMSPEEASKVFLAWSEDNEE